MKAPSPAFSFYPKDWLSDGAVKAMTLEERGAYIELLSIYWLEGGLPADPGRLAKLIGVGRRTLERLWPALAPCFQTEGTRLRQKRLDEEISKQLAFRESQRLKGQKGAKSRWNNTRDIAQASPGHDSGNAQAMPGDSLPSPSPSPSTTTPPNPPLRGGSSSRREVQASVDRLGQAHRELLGERLERGARRDLAARLRSGETEAEIRAGYEKLAEELGRDPPRRKQEGGDE